MMRRTILLIALFIVPSVPCLAAELHKSAKMEGTITGSVLTEDGQAAPNMEVCTSIHQTSGGFEHTVTCCTGRTDAQGRFTIGQLEIGKYEVIAKNDEEGYSIENQSPGPEVTLTEKNLQQYVTIRLRKKGAVFIAAITDKGTGQIIHDANVGFEGVDCDAGGNMLRDSDGRYYLSIPTDCDVVVIVRAKGYKGWVYMDAANPPQPVLRLQPGQRKALSIQLEPLPKESSKR
jgi:hypothetical protein